ncbi:MAG: polysaccharide biosynthesis protein [Chitinispirillaceae bacterium]
MAFLVRFDFSLGHGSYPQLFWISLPINIIIFLIFSGIFNLYQGIWRYVSVDDLRDIVKTAAIASLVFMFIIIFSGRFHGYPRSIYVLNYAFFIIFNGGTRFSIRTFRESFAPMSDNARNVLIIGAGSAGNEIAKTLKSSKKKEYIPVGFIDRDPSIHGKRIQGIKVLGDLSTIRQHIKKHRVHEVFIAIPEATNSLVKDILERVKIPDWEVKLKIAPSVLDIMSGKYQLNQIREVSINDLLSRPNITLDDKHVRKQIAGKTVFITGAGGSIGSEISYQVAAYDPSRLILIDSGEENAYRIDRDLKKRHPDIAIHTVVGSILDSAVIDMVMKEYRPDFVFHAAAYKHVHLMEWNPIAAFKNNVLGTALLAASAEKCGVKQFVMISTDKAVNPRGVMGLSKRLAERVVLERYPSKTLFNVVRFGNVLGSSGSVIPLFQKQIRDGGPVTVTSPETKRYFMSIPEAVQLVLQASTLKESNTIFMLEMGEPVKIVDLARNLIELSGLKVDEDIEIKFTGMRPGEKIFEELLTADENLLKTPFEKIRMQRNIKFDPDVVQKFVHDLKSHVDLGNIKGVYKDVKTLIPEMTGPTFEELRQNMFA